MNKSDLKHVKEYYCKYNEMLFNNSLPAVDKIDFILHSLEYAAGYSKYTDKPTKSGNHHIIAFCRYFIFSDKQIQEILIHEMIHLWQVYHVKEDRYKICSNDIAHDRVFLSKMATINLILQKNWCDLTITQVCNYKLRLDDRLDSKKDFYVLILTTDYGKEYVVKTCEKNFDKCLENYKKDNFKSISYLKTNSYVFCTLPYTVKVQDSLTTLDSYKNFGIDIHKMFDSVLTRLEL